MIVVDHVSKYFGARPAVSDLSFRIDRGECVGLLGLNGAGKSTTLRLLCGLSLPTSGTIHVDGLDVVESPEALRRHIGYLPDRPPLYDEMTVEDYLDFVGGLRGLGGDALADARRRALSRCAIAAVRGQLIGNLSHGFRQRVGIAQAILHGPSLLVLDEPIQGLDPVQIVQMRQMLAELRGEHTILLSTHILSEIEQTCDRILMIHEGRLAASGSEAELQSKLRGGRRFTLQVRGAPETLRRALADVPGVEPVGEATEVEGVHGMTVSLGPDVGPEALSRAVVEAGLGLCALVEARSGLESVFVALSSGGASASTPPDAPMPAPTEAVDG